MSKFKNLKKGSILSETSFYIVDSISGDYANVRVEGQNEGEIVSIASSYLNSLLDSADYVVSEEKKTMTELIEIIKENPRKAMTVTFFKQDVSKTQKAYKAEVESKISEFENATMGSLRDLVMSLIENPLSKTIPGEERVMKGRHHGFIDEKGRVHFIDMEITFDPKNPDSRLRQIDTRTIQSIIVNNIKYVLKK